MSLLSMIISSFLLALVTGCGQREQVTSDADLQTKLLGTWMHERDDEEEHYKSVVVYRPDGTFAGESTNVGSNKTSRASEAGTFLVKGGVLVVTTTRNNSPAARLPRVDRLPIVRVDDRELVVTCEERLDLGPFTFRREKAEAKVPHHSAALDEAKKVNVSVVKFDGLPLTLVISMLQDESVKRDPAGKGLKISLDPNAKELADAVVSLELKDVTLAGVLERVAETVSLKLEATDTELLLVKKGGKQ